MVKINLLEFELPDSCKADSESFDDLAVDEDLRTRTGKEYRRRRLSKFCVEFDKDGEIIIHHLEHEAFNQSAEYNLLFPNKTRYFPPLTINPNPQIEFVTNLLPIDRRSAYQVDVHQIRITCDEKTQGSPVPEGWHRDGFQYVAILVIGRKNIKGGKTSIRAQGDKGDLLLEATLPAGAGIVFDDIAFEHYTSDIESIDGLGNRDVFILTFIEWSKRKYKGNFKPIRLRENEKLAA